MQLFTIILSQHNICYIIKILELQELNSDSKFLYLGLKEQFSGNHKKAIYWYRKYLIVYPNNKFILNKVLLCQNSLGKL